MNLTHITLSEGSLELVLKSIRETRDRLVELMGKVKGEELHEIQLAVARSAGSLDAQVLILGTMMENSTREEI